MEQDKIKELCHSAIKKYDEENLYHSDTYLGEDYSDGIKHWKYVKKETINGKTRYYYSDAEYENAIKDYYKAKSDYSAAYINKNRAYENYQKTRSKESNNVLNKGAKALDVADVNIRIARKLSDEADKKYKSASVEYDKAYTKYQNTTIKTFARRTIATGVAAVMNFFTKFKK